MKKTLREEFRHVVRRPNLSLNDRGQTALHMAAARGDVDQLKLILSHGADANKCDRDGVTPLRYAIRAGHLDVVKALIQSKKVDVNFISDDGVSHLHSAVWRGKRQIAVALIEAGADVDARKNEHLQTPLHLCAHRDDHQMAAILIKAGAKLDVPDHGGATAVQLAAYAGSVNVLDHLLKADSSQDIDHMAFAYGMSAFHFAVRNGHVRVVERLIDAGADLTHKTENGLTALHIAAEEGDVSMIKLLVKYGAADMHVTAEETGQTPLHVAAYNGRLDAMAALILLGADPEKTDKQGRTALGQAAWRGRSACVRYLMQMGAEPNTSKKSVNYSPLGEAIFYGHRDLANEMLGSTKVDVNHHNKNGISPLHIAVMQNETALVEKLIKRGADVNKFCKETVSPLFMAAQKDNLKIMTMLLDAGATAMHLGGGEEGDLYDYARNADKQAVLELLQWHQSRRYAAHAAGWNKWKSRGKKPGM